MGLIDALGAEQAVIGGHDWGAPAAWLAALLRPDRFRGVIGLSGPYGPRGPRRPTTVIPQSADASFYQLYFQAPGVAEAEFERDVRFTMRTILYSISGDTPHLIGSVVDPETAGMVARKGGFLSRMTNPASLPPWLNEADVDFYAGEFARTGFRGGLNWYRNIDRNWELLAPFGPLCRSKGDGPRALHGRRTRHRAGLSRRARPHFQPVEIRPAASAHDQLPGCGHWTQQERAAEVNAAVIDFLRALPSMR